MNRSAGLIINIGEVLTGKMSQATFPINHVIDQAPQDEGTIVSPITGDVRFIALDQGVIGFFRIRATMRLFCSADGEPFDAPVSLVFDSMFKPDEEDAASQILPNNAIDLEPILRDELALNIPMKPLCPNHKET